MTAIAAHLSSISPEEWAAILALPGVFAAAWLLYVSTLKVARHNVLVGTITAERAKWRSELPATTGELVEETLLFIQRPTSERLARIARLRTSIRLRLNHKREDKHHLDRDITIALQALGAALNDGRNVAARDHLAEIERKAQRLLKQEWEKSKDEAKSGKLSA